MTHWSLRSSCIEPIFLDDLYGYLLTHEQRLEHVNLANEIIVSTANVAQRNTPISGRNQPQKQFSNTSNPSYGRGCGWGRGRFSASTSNRPICQICNRIGHIASKCYNKFDHSHHSDSTNPVAYLTSQQFQPDQNWYPDTSSTNYLTNDLSNLNLRTKEYKGTDQIKVSNGQGLDILHTGLAQISSSTKNFTLPNLLHVPQIEKNLISVNQFTHDNQVFIEFHPRCFRVKDLCLGNLLLHGSSKGGLYP
jgi:hypothetical protein